MKRKYAQQQGFGLLEIVIAMSIFAVAGVTIIAAFSTYIQTGVSNTNRVQALYLLDSGTEAVRFLRNASYTNNIATLTSSTTYYLATSTNGWTLSQIPSQFFNTHTVEVMFNDVYRRTIDHDIIPESSTDPKSLDPDTKRVTVKVIWGDGTPSSKSGTIQAITYLTNFIDE